MGLVHINRNYGEKKENFNILVDEVLRLETKININDQKIKNYNFMAFKANAFSKRYSQFSNILDIVFHKSRTYGFEPNLVLGIVQVESAFNPKAISHRGAYGLMQVNLQVWEEELAIDRKYIFDVEYNIDLGLQILKRYYDESGGNLKRALHLYNNGYKYNNMAYTDRVDSAVLSFKPNKFHLTVASIR